MKLNFTDNKYKNKVFELAILSQNKQVSHSNEEVFLLCIRGIDYGDIDNYCKLLSNKLNIPELTPQKCYELLNSEDVPSFVVKNLLSVAYECVDKYQNLGTKKTPDDRFVTSSWLSHSLYEAKLAGELAGFVGLNQDVAFQMGLLHDIGRKKTHDFSHTIKGFEYLIDEGYEDMALCSLTHSFLMDFTSGNGYGGRYANCDAADDGFYVDDQLIAHTENIEEIDDMSVFLSIYDYSLYDMILNIADLMSTDKGIVEPFVRVKDVASRKAPDIRNRNYFINNFINVLTYFLYECNYIEQFKIFRENNSEDAYEKFRLISKQFMEFYYGRLEEKQYKKILNSSGRQ